MKDCEFCYPELNTEQIIVFENKSCRFLILRANMDKGIVLEGSGVIVTKSHKESPFELNDEEWINIKKMLDQSKKYIDKKYKPDGYNIGWNVKETGGQHIEHCHLHIIPRYSNELLSGKGIRSYLKSDNNKRI